MARLDTLISDAKTALAAAKDSSEEARAIRDFFRDVATLINGKPQGGNIDADERLAAERALPWLSVNQPRLTVALIPRLLPLARPRRVSLIDDDPAHPATILINLLKEPPHEVLFWYALRDSAEQIYRASDDRDLRKALTGALYKFTCEDGDDLSTASTRIMAEASYALALIVCFADKKSQHYRSALDILAQIFLRNASYLDGRDAPLHLTRDFIAGCTRVEDRARIAAFYVKIIDGRASMRNHSIASPQLDFWFPYILEHGGKQDRDAACVAISSEFLEWEKIKKKNKETPGDEQMIRYMLHALRYGTHERILTRFCGEFLPRIATTPQLLDMALDGVVRAFLENRTSRALSENFAKGIVVLSSRYTDDAKAEAPLRAMFEERDTATEKDEVLRKVAAGAYLLFVTNRAIYGEKNPRLRPERERYFETREALIEQAIGIVLSDKEAQESKVDMANMCLAVLINRTHKRADPEKLEQLIKLGVGQVHRGGLKQLKERTDLAGMRAWIRELLGKRRADLVGVLRKADRLDL